MLTDLGDCLSINYELEGFSHIDNLFRECDEELKDRKNSLHMQREEDAYYNWLDKKECDRCVRF